jgi:hypothetical protein
MNLKTGKFQFLAFGFAMLVVCAIVVHAQSGRRQTKPAPAAPVPSPTPEPTPAPKPQQKEPEIGFLLGADRYTSYESYPLSYYDAAMRGCGDRLRSASSARVDVSQNNLTRGEAIKKAKAETNTYVVYMKLVLDEAARSLDDLELEYVVFAPQTGKVVTSGRAYLNTNRKGPIIVGPRGSTGGLYREELLKRAGEDAAERILKALNLSVPVLR